jgi:transposase
MGSRRIHSKEFKVQAVRLASEPGAMLKKTAEDLGIHPSLLQHWKKQFLTGGGQAFPGHGRLQPDDEEIRKLRLELKRVTEERDILKKATLFFAQESRRR